MFSSHGHSHDQGHGHSHDQGHGHSHSHDQGKPSFLMPFWDPELLGEERNLENGPRPSQMELLPQPSNPDTAREGRTVFPLPQMSPQAQQQMQLAQMHMMQRGQMTPEMFQQMQAARMQMMQQMMMSGGAPGQQLPADSSAPVPAASILTASPATLLMRSLRSAVTSGKKKDGSSEYELQLEAEVRQQKQALLALVVAILRQDPNAAFEKDDEGRTLLHHACLHGQLDVATLLLRRGADISARDNCGATAVHMAALCGDPVVLQRLRESGGDLRATDSDGQTAMHYAAAASSGHTLHYLSECGGLSYSALDLKGRSLLHVACQQKDTAETTTVVKLLLRHDRLDLRLVDADGCNAMHYAAEGSLAHVCYVLACAGSSRLAAAANSAGLTPLDFARRGASTEHYYLFREMEAWLHNNQPYYPNASKPSLWYQHLLWPTVCSVLPALLSVYLTPHNQGWITLLGCLLSMHATFKGSHRIQHISRLPNPAQLGGVCGCLAQMLLMQCFILLPEVYSQRPLTAAVLALSIPVSLYLYARLCFGDPGFSSQSKRKESGDLYTMQDLVSIFQQPLIWCAVCEIVPTKPTKHCKLCDRCCFRMDQHCLLAMNCVGDRNRLQCVWFNILVLAQQLATCSLALTYCFMEHPQADVWSALYDEFNHNAWMFALCATSCWYLFLSAWLLMQSLNLLSKGYTAIFQPQAESPTCSLSTREQLENIVHFLFSGKLKVKDPLFDL